MDKAEIIEGLDEITFDDFAKPALEAIPDWKSRCASDPNLKGYFISASIRDHDLLWRLLSAVVTEYYRFDDDFRVGVDGIGIITTK